MSYGAQKYITILRKIKTFKHLFFNYTHSVIISTFHFMILGFFLEDFTGMISNQFLVQI